MASYTAASARPCRRIGAIACLTAFTVAVLLLPGRHSVASLDGGLRRLQQHWERRRPARGPRGMLRRQQQEAVAPNAQVDGTESEPLGTTPEDVAWRREHCAPLPQWPPSRFSADQDWVPLADGADVAADTLWRWEGGRSGRLLNQASRGYLNYRGAGLVRGHGDTPPFVAAPASAKGTLLHLEAVTAEPYRQDAPPCGRAPATFALRFVEGGTYLEVDASDGTLFARVSECSDLALCLWDLEPQPAPNAGWLALRSRLTGRLMRMVDKTHVPFGGWDGVSHKAQLKLASELRAQRAAAAAAISGSAPCPLRPGVAAEPGWHFNGSVYSAQIRDALEPWHAGGLSATALDAVFWHQLYPPQNKAEQPSLHMSLLRGGLRFVWQPRDGEPGGIPPPNSTDAALLAMLGRISRLVVLPEIELVAHTFGLPAIPKQNPEPVLAPVTDAAHADIPAPSVWAWAAATADQPRCPAARTRRSQLLIEAQCEGPVDGFRGPLWRWYPPHLAAMAAARQPRLMHAVLRRACSGPLLPGGGLPVLEAAWGRLAGESLARTLADAGQAAAARREARHPRAAPVGSGVSSEPEGAACDYRWLLLLDGTGPPRQLLTRLRQGFTVFRQASPYRQHFEPALQPWRHFVPVQENLADLPARVRWAAANPEQAAAIARRGRAWALSLHQLEIACYWWQLLTAMAPLQDHAPRGSEFGRLHSSS
eukprot:scaffold2584_cov113-Isochrysis_galbana.AAC.10